MNSLWNFLDDVQLYNTEDGIMRDDSEILPGQNFL